MDPTKSIHVDDLEEAHEETYRLGWTDDPPVIPPDAKLVNAANELHSHRGKGRGELGHGRLPA